MVSVAVTTSSSLRLAAAGCASIAAFTLLPALSATAAPTVVPSPAPTVSSTPATAPQTPEQIDTPAQFAVALLRQGQWPVSGNNVCALMAWEAAEGGHFVAGASRYNPLNTTQSMPGDSIFNSVGVRNYPDWATGLTATTQTLSLGFYDQIRAALTDGRDASAVLNAVAASPWGTKFEGSGTGVSSGCTQWAADFDRKRASAVAAIGDADAAIAKATPKLAAATATQAKLVTKYNAMQADIQKAQLQLAIFARSLYIAGVEPEIVSKLEAVQSGDPIAYTLLRSYPGLSANRNADAINRAIDLLAEVGASRQRAADAVAAATNEIQAAEQRKAKADEQLAEIEKNSLPT